MPRFQFSTSALLSITAFMSVWFGGIIVWSKVQGVPFFEAPEEILGPFVIYGPFWLPLVFLAYGLGRRTITIRIVLAFALGEAAAIGTLWWMMRGYQ
jgi:hypothetical protein